MTIRDTFVDVANGDQLDDGYFNGIQPIMESELSVSHMARIDQLRIMSDSDIALTERGDAPTDTARDIMSDTTGYNNLVDTGTTTAYYHTSTKSYIRAVSNGVTDDAYTTFANSSATNSLTVSCSHVGAGKYFIITKVYLGYSNNGGGTTTITIKDGSANTLASKTLSHSVNESKELDFTYADYTRALYNENFTITYTDTVGGAIRYQSGVTKSSDGLYSTGSVSWPGSRYDTNSGDQNFPVATEVIFAASTVQTVDLAGSGSDINSLFMQAQKDDDGVNLITYDASSDNGSTWTTGLSFEQLKVLSSTLGHHLIVRFQIPNDYEAKMYGFSTQWWR